MQKYNFFLKQQTFVYTNFKFSPKKQKTPQFRPQSSSEWQKTASHKA